MAALANLFSRFSPNLNNVCRVTSSLSSSLFSGNIIHPVKVMVNAVQPPANSTLLNSGAPTQMIQTRGRYLCWRMKRDVKRRTAVKKYATDKLRVNAIRKNSLIPREIQEIADVEMKAFPIDSCRSRVNDRCVLTSRSRGLVKPHNVSRIMFRILADYNQMSGVIRAKW